MHTPTTLRVIFPVLLLVCLPAILWGDTIIYDGFEYATGILGGNGGGLGWSDNWSGANVVAAPGLSYEGLPAIGNKAGTDGSTELSYRSLNDPIDASNSSFWVGFICQSETEVGWSGISTCDASGNETLFLGSPWQGSSPRFWGVHLYNTLNDSGVSIDAQYSGIVSTEKVWMVVKVVNGDSNAQLTAWLNPRPDEEPDESESFFHGTVGRIEVAQIRMGGSADGNVYYDELYLGDTFADITGGDIYRNLAPEVELGEDRDVVWQGGQMASVEINPEILDDDPDGLGQTNPDYLTIQWSCPADDGVVFRPGSSEGGTEVIFPAPGDYSLLLQVWDELNQEGSDTVQVTVTEPLCPISDFNGNCIVDLADVQVLIQQWLDPAGCEAYPGNCADRSGDGLVALADFGGMALDWLQDWNGKLQVILNPVEVQSQARWRLAGGDWKQSGEIISNLIEGTYSLEYSGVNGWLKPNDQDIFVTKRVTTELDSHYAETPGSPVVITEFMARNRHVVGQSTLFTVVEGQMVFRDWIEIANVSSEPVNLGGWYLTDEKAELEKWPLPAVDLAAGAYLVVFASGIEAGEHPENYPYRDGAGNYHTNFKLDGSGEYLALIGPDLSVASEYDNLPDQEEFISYGTYQDQRGYFAVATPRAANNACYTEIAEKPFFAKASGTFTQGFLLALTPPESGGTIRYTLNGTMPTESSLVYSSPLAIIDTVEVRARFFKEGKVPSPVECRTYIAVSSELAGVTSDVPIIVIDTRGTAVSASDYVKCEAAFFDTNAQGVASVTGSIPDFIGQGGIHIRGSSSEGFAKKQYSFETWDLYNEDKDVSLLGMPAGSDWVIYGPQIFDRALINNALIYELSNRMGRYAVRTRFCELYLDPGTGAVGSDDYLGLYIFMEKIARGDDRVDVENLDPWDSREPQITGGYMLSIDKVVSDDLPTFKTSRGTPNASNNSYCNFHYLYPRNASPEGLTGTQASWIRGYLDNFETALWGPNATDPVSGYARYIDVGSFIDHNLLNMLAMNVDGLRISTYMFKKRGGKLEMGPIWDFDRSFDSTDSRDNNPQAWDGTGDATSYFTFENWWAQLFSDIDFMQRYIDRWWELRQDVLLTSHLNILIDSMASEANAAATRNYQKWTSYPSRYSNFQGEINHLKSWLGTRVAWIDGQFAKPPVATPASGAITAGSTVTLANPNGTGEIWYTLDGTDPRVFGPASSVEIETVTLIDENKAKKVLVPNAAVDEGWKGSDLAFDDSGWTTYNYKSGAAGGVGYCDGSDDAYYPYYSYDVRDWMFGTGKNASCLIRIHFNVDAELLNEIDVLKIKVRADDGFVAYLNGRDNIVARYNNVYNGVTMDQPTWYARVNDGGESVDFREEIDISSFIGELRAGDNILAIHGMNSSVRSSDFLIGAVLEAQIITGDTGGQLGSPGDVADTAIRYTGQPIAINETTRLRARVRVPSNAYSRWSGLTRATYTLGQLTDKLRITEIMYHPADDPAGVFNEEDFEFIELLNTSDETIDLRWVQFDKGIDYTFGSTLLLGAGEHMVLVSNPEAFAARYDTSGILIAPGAYGGRLNNGGERIRLIDPLGQTILDFDYKDGWSKPTDGEGFSLTIIDPENPDPLSWDDGSSWDASTLPGGSPGAADAILPDQAVVINEILAHTDNVTGDWIELYNATTSDINIGGWYLSDDRDNRYKYRIAPNTIIHSDDYLVFTGVDDFNNSNNSLAEIPFALSENGEDICLTQVYNGVPGGYRKTEDFGASQRDVTFGRWYNSTTGNYNFVAMAEATPLAANGDPKVWDVVISEIMYNPPEPEAGSLYDDNDEFEFVELANRTDAAVRLDVWSSLAGDYVPWAFTGGIEMAFPANSTIAPNGRVVVVRNRAAFKLRYPAVPDSIIFEFDKKLDNDGENVDLSIPGDPKADGSGDYYFIRIDRVEYSDGFHGEDFPGGVDPWPWQANGNDPGGTNPGLGYSLQRIDLDVYGNNAANWQAARATPGY